MKSNLIFAGAVCAIVLGWTTVHVFAAPKGDAVSISGEIVDLHCYLDREAKGEGHKTCAATCCKFGHPVAILTDKGELYLLMGEKKNQTANDMFADKMGSTLTVTGVQVKKGGLQAIYVSSVK